MSAANLELIVFRWLDAVRRRDPAVVADHLAPDVVWSGLRPDLRCADRDEVLRNIAPGGVELREHVRGLELVAEGDRVLLGLRMPDITELLGEPVDGALFEVFTVRDGTIVAIEEFGHRDAALAALRAPRAPAVVDGLVPFVHVADVARSAAFYGLLGFTVQRTHHHRRRLDWVSLEHADARLMLAHATAPVDPAEQAVLFYLYSSDLAALRAHLLAHGAEPGPIEDGTPGPVEELRLEDPDGYVLMIAQRNDR